MPVECDRSLIKGGWSIGLFSGEVIDLKNLRDEDIDFDSIIHSLSLQCRYMGHVRHHYSIAQHSLYVHDMVRAAVGAEGRASFAALIHDFSEGMLHDLVRGIKVGILNESPCYHDMEQVIQDRIARVAGIPSHEDYHDIVKEWDNKVLKSEVLALFTPGTTWMKLLENLEPAPVRVDKWEPEFAESELKKEFSHYQELVKKGKI